MYSTAGPGRAGPLVAEFELVFRPYAAADSPEFGYGGRMGTRWIRS